MGVIRGFFHTFGGGKGGGDAFACFFATFRLTPLLWALSGALAMGAEEKIKQNHDNKNIISKNHDK